MTKPKIRKIVFPHFLFTVFLNTNFFSQTIIPWTSRIETIASLFKPFEPLPLIPVLLRLISKHNPNPIFFIWFRSNNGFIHLISLLVFLSANLNTLSISEFRNPKQPATFFSWWISYSTSNFRKRHNRSSFQAFDSGAKRSRYNFFLCSFFYCFGFSKNKTLPFSPLIFEQWPCLYLLWPNVIAIS